MISSFEGDSFCIWKETEEFRDSSGWRTYEKDEELYLSLIHIFGTPQRMIDHSILGQIAIYFMLPLSLAIVHAMVGVPVVSLSLIHI